MGIVMNVAPGAGRDGGDAVDIRFEDGEVQTVSSMDEDAILLPEEWSTRVSMPLRHSETEHANLLPIKSCARFSKLFSLYRVLLIVFV